MNKQNKYHKETINQVRLLHDSKYRDKILRKLTK